MVAIIDVKSALDKLVTVVWHRPEGVFRQTGKIPRWWRVCRKVCR
jgi:hypothetical protein